MGALTGEIWRLLMYCCTFRCSAASTFSASANCSSNGMLYLLRQCPCILMPTFPGDLISRPNDMLRCPMHRQQRPPRNIQPQNVDAAP